MTTTKEIMVHPEVFDSMITLKAKHMLPIKIKVKQEENKQGLMHLEIEHEESDDMLWMWLLNKASNQNVIFDPDD